MNYINFLLKSESVKICQEDTWSNYIDYSTNSVRDILNTLVFGLV